MDGLGAIRAMAAATDDHTLRRKGRIGLLATLALVLVACGQPVRIASSSLGGTVTAEQAFALPPPGGPSVVGVIERRYSNAVRHEIALATDSGVAGQNMMRVTLMGATGSGGGGETTLSDLPATRAEIGREMRAAFPGVAMEVSPLFSQNSYGPFGHATGRRGRDLCLYAWQRMRGTGAVDVRLRLCERDGREEDLLDIVYNYTINASFASPVWNPFGTTAPADPRLGTPGQEIRPAVPRTPAPQPRAAASTAPAVRPAPPVAAPPAAAPPLPAPPVGAPMVPPPPSPAPEAIPVIPPPPPAADGAT